MYDNLEIGVLLKGDICCEDSISVSLSVCFPDLNFALICLFADSRERPGGRNQGDANGDGRCHQETGLGGIQVRGEKRNILL